MDNLIEAIIRHKIPVYFISPHLDDAVFSAGDLMAYLSKHTKVTVINIFTEADNTKTTLSAKMFLRQCREQDAQKLFSLRKLEDKMALATLGIEPDNLGFLDALWRFKGKFWKGLPAEFDAVYPTYRFHATKGKISDHDQKLFGRIKQKLSEKVFGQAIVLAPLAVGGHVDHVITREACSQVFSNVIYWTDFPYSKKSMASEEFISGRNLKRVTFQNNLQSKVGLIRNYKSQVEAMFPAGDISLQSETYYLPKELS